MAMNRQKDMIERNIELSAEFSRYLFEHAELDEAIPKDAEIVLLPEHDKELKDFNIELGKKIEEEGTRVAYVTIKGIRPKELSRIKSIELNVA
jgi:hypothetical protein